MCTEKSKESSRVETLTRRLEMPIFEGLNLEGWVFHVERFFTVHRMTEEEKMAAAMISLDGEAMAWFQWEEGRRPIQGWSELKAQILDRFSITQEGTLCEQFLALKQEGTVREYLCTFELLAATLAGCRNRFRRVPSSMV